MSPEISERSFEEAIERGLLRHGPDVCAGDTAVVRETPPPYGDTPPGGYRKRRPEDYDRALCLLPRDVVDFVLATQPKEWQKLAQHHGAAVKEQFLKRLAAQTELKNPLNGQDVEDAIRQYKTDRDPREPLLAYGRLLAHFATACSNSCGSSSTR